MIKAIKSNRKILLVVWITSLWLGVPFAYASDGIFVEHDILNLKAFFYRNWNEDWRKDPGRDKFAEFVKSNPCGVFSEGEATAIGTILRQTKDPKGQDTFLSPIAQMRNSTSQIENLKGKISEIDTNMNIVPLHKRLGKGYRDLREKRKIFENAFKTYSEQYEASSSKVDDDHTLSEINSILGRISEKQARLRKLAKNIIPLPSESLFKESKGPETSEKRKGPAQASERQAYFSELGKLQVQYLKLLRLARPKEERPECKEERDAVRSSALFDDINAYFMDNKRFAPVDMFKAKNEHTGEYDGRRESTANSNSLKSVDEDESPLRRRSSSGSSSAGGAQ